MILDICDILDVNSFEVPNISPSCSGTVQAVYADAGCLAEHNCVPTAHRTFNEDLSLCLRAAIPLNKEEHISITYTDSLWPTAERRSHLMGTKVKQTTIFSLIKQSQQVRTLFNEKPFNYLKIKLTSTIFFIFLVL